MKIRAIILGCSLLMLSPAPLLAQTAEDSLEADKQRYLDAVGRQIAGKEDKPASEVFKNLKMLKDVPAGRLLRIMNFAYSRSLGVSCTHCHIAGEWASDEKPPKLVAREMAAMVQKINSEFLANIDHLRTEKPVINCTTCHRGQTQPALSMPRGKNQ